MTKDKGSLHNFVGQDAISKYIGVQDVIEGLIEPVTGFSFDS